MTEIVPGVVVDTIGGYCPVQAEGNIDGTPFYFRARGCRWRLHVGDDPLDRDSWSYGEEYDPPDGDTSIFAAGWMDITEAESFIAAAARRYRRQRVG